MGWDADKHDGDDDALCSGIYPSLCIAKVMAVHDYDLIISPGRSGSG
jgi:hypothetical protein